MSEVDAKEKPGGFVGPETDVATLEHLAPIGHAPCLLIRKWMF